MAERLIDVETYEADIRKGHCKNCTIKNSRYCTDFCETTKFLKALAKIPTIEAKPIVHAHWEEQNDGTHFCSRCGNDATYTYEGKEFVGFLCPYCGAQMDEKFVTDTNVGSKKE